MSTAAPKADAGQSTVALSVLAMLVFIGANVLALLLAHAMAFHA